MQVRKHILLATISLISLMLTSSAKAQNAEQCRDQANAQYQACLSGTGGGGGGSACNTQTRCEDLCLGGQRQCRVFDCRGLIINTYYENCLVQPTQYSCSACYSAGFGPGTSYSVKYCYKVHNRTNGQSTLIDTFCTPFDYSGLDLCINEHRSDARCEGSSVL